MDSEDTIPASQQGKPRILAVCPPPGVVAFLREAVDVTIETVRTKAQAQDFLVSQEWALFLLHHRGLGGGGESFLSKIRQRRQGAHVPIVYCLGKQTDPELAKKLVADFGFQSLLTYPQDPQEIAHHIADLLNLSVRNRENPTGRLSTGHEDLSSSQETQWDSF